MDRFQRKLHHGTANGVVLIIDTVYSDVDISATFTVHRKNRIAVFRWIVGIGGFYTRSQIGEICHVTTHHRKLFDFLWRDVLAHIGFGRVDEQSFGRNFNDLSCGSWPNLRIDNRRLTDQDFDCP